MTVLLGPKSLDIGAADKGAALMGWRSKVAVSAQASSTDGLGDGSERDADEIGGLDLSDQVGMVPGDVGREGRLGVIEIAADERGTGGDIDAPASVLALGSEYKRKVGCDGVNFAVASEGQVELVDQQLICVHRCPRIGLGYVTELNQVVLNIIAELSQVVKRALCIKKDCQNGNGLPFWQKVCQNGRQVCRFGRRFHGIMFLHWVEPARDPDPLAGARRFHRVQKSRIQRGEQTWRKSLNLTTLAGAA